MNRVVKIAYAFVLTLAVFLGGCKSSQIVNNSFSDIPESFEGRMDSVSSATLNWKDYFQDTLLIDLIHTALRNNHDLLMAFQRIEMVRSQARLSKSALLPTAGAEVSASRQKFARYTMDGAGNIDTPIDGEQIVPVHLPDYYVGLQTSWELDVWGKLKNKKAAALSRYMSGTEGKNWTITNLISEIASGYYELVSLDLQLQIILEAIDLQKNAFEVSQFKKEAGRINALVVKQFEAQFVNSQALELEIRQDISEAENKLNFLLGRYPEPIERVHWTFSSAVPFNTDVGIPSGLLRHRPDIKRAEFDLLAAKADMNSARAAFYPSFNITGGYGFQAFKTGYLFASPESTAYSLLGSVAAPLINRSVIKAEFRHAKAAQIEAMYQYQKSILNGFMEVNNELLNIRNLDALSSLKNREVELMSESIDISSELFRTGRSNYLEVIVIQQKALDTKIELVKIKKNQFDAAIHIYKALGGGWM